MAETMVAAVPPPDPNIPESDATVKVSCIDSTTFVKLPMSPFLQPDYKGKPYLTGPAFSFLIEHAPSSTKLLFDLGTRKDWRNLPPVIVDRITSGGWTVDVKQNVSEILTSSGIDVSSGAIDAVIWSHHHWDHTGDLSGTFPSSTDLVVGPGFKEAHLPGYPTDPKGAIHAADFENRTVREVDITIEGKGLKIGRFAAYDYFGDGSFYLLDTPGHSVGHICGLARTTPSKDGETFVFMGGDACHHGGEFRPTPHLPLPKELNPAPEGLKQRLQRATCPGHLLLDVHRNKKADEPYYLVTEKFAQDLEKANWTIDGVGEFDAHEEVLVLIAHDDSVEGMVPLWPEGLNDWREKDVARKVKWRFLGDFAEGVKVE